MDFPSTFEAALDVLLEHRPEHATALGEHAYDDRLSDYSAAGCGAYAEELGQALAAVDGIDESELSLQDQVDLEMLRSRLAGELWEVTELAPHTWDPMLHLPGDAVYTLVARPPQDRDLALDRLTALTARLRGVSQSLATARDVLRDVPRVHAETAVGQAHGAMALLGEDVQHLVEVARPGAEDRRDLDAAVAEAAEALTEHTRWLSSLAEQEGGEPRLGAQRFAARLWSTLDTEIGPDALLTRAESDLMAVETEIEEVAAALAPRLGVGQGRGAGALVREVLDALAADAPVKDSTILGLCEDELARLTDVVRADDLVTVLDDEVRVVVMPESRRGVAVAYCDPPGPLEPDGPQGPAPTFFAVSPTPVDWPADRVASFYREYNGHLLRDLTVHEAMPGHVLQLAHARRFTASGQASTRVRAALWSGTFVEGWAVHAEEVMARHLDDGSVAGLALRMQQLKMRLRTTINAVLDVRVHAHGMTQDEAMALMTGRGHQEEGEAAGKWRRALLTSTQLSTYYVGHQEVGQVVADLRAAHPDRPLGRVHDAVLSHGSPSPRHLRRLVGLP